MNLYVLALHIIFVVTWFSGLFYIVRLFIYHVEAEKKTEPERSILQDQYKLMEKRLWYIIAWPSMIGVYVFGFWMAIENYTYYFSSPWFILKLCFVFGLTLYHLRCQVIYSQLRNNSVKHSSFKLRIWNEVAVLFLVSIVFIVVLKDTMRFTWALLWLIFLGAALYIAIRMYRDRREKKNSSSLNKE